MNCLCRCVLIFYVPICSDDAPQTYKHIFVSPSSAKETNKSTHGGNAALHNITFVTYESIAYVATVVSGTFSPASVTDLLYKTRFALSDEPFFGPRGSEADKQRRRGFPYRMFYREILEHKDLMSEDELINLIQWWNECVYLIRNIISTDLRCRKIFPRTTYTNDAVRMNSAGAIMREHARVKRAEREAAKQTAESGPSGGTPTSISEEI